MVLQIASMSDTTSTEMFTNTAQLTTIQFNSPATSLQRSQEDVEHDLLLTKNVTEEQKRSEVEYV